MDGPLFDKKIKEIFSSEINRDRVANLTYRNYRDFFGCSQSMCSAFLEILRLKSNFSFKALGALQSGGGCGLTCGALYFGLILISARVGREKLEEGQEGLRRTLEESHKLYGWFKQMWGSTICSEITGLNWFDLDEVTAHYSSPRGAETIEKCAEITGGTAYKLAEILSQL